MHPEVVPPVVIEVVGQLLTSFDNPVPQRASRYVDDRFVGSHPRCGLQVLHAFAKRLRNRRVPSPGFSVGDGESPFPLVVEALEVSRLHVPHFVAAETVESKVESDTSPWVFVLNEREEFLLFRA
ncbi:hypothetical protein [Haloferax sp. Atlit-48N]|uniref:Uncharacterized protein n=1 Tax=Haloferax sp. Atlit-48N TaxID=2077198 RepID=A0ACD5HWR0_9EURY